MVKTNLRYVYTKGQEQEDKGKDFHDDNPFEILERCSQTRSKQIH